MSSIIKLDENECKITILELLKMKVNSSFNQRKKIRVCKKMLIQRRYTDRPI